MYYKKLDIPNLPEDLMAELLESALSLYNNNENRAFYHRAFDEKDSNTLNYLGGEDLDFYAKSGGVSAIRMGAELETKVKEFYKQANHPITNVFDYYGFLIVEGPYVAPHIDDLNRRRNGFQLLLKSGGASTAWYEVKDEFKDAPLIEVCGVPYSKLNKATEVKLEENCWYWMKFDTIHSVENQDSVRIFLGAGNASIIDYTYLVKDL